ncbi:protein POLLEN DEFECTIVE IN GUIDANCE 1 [Pyrus ussuriensis x Pyrus communis]|uniref:Protein POLLEN DEFECTIVE IN GUIDANCE 1 n=1 Tax=Pyrus ussuriensis x Pyrus communis TaxID=2448454 RepID=A0A5N5FSY6_9ROSA|nr:protein POLLEN DEFECTIVE IN GUIDANCE 1 [Pyrus ussuriensis x Pyrus communis]
MALRSNGRNLSFEILRRNGSLDDEHDEAIFYRSNSDPLQSDQSTNAKSARTKRKKKKKKKKTPATAHASIPESPTAIYGVVSNSFDVNSETTNVETGDIRGNGLEFNYRAQTVLLPVTTEVVDPEFQNLRGAAELRQRTVIGSAGGVVEETETASPRIQGEAKEESVAEGGSASKQRSEPNGNVIPKLQTAESLDWKRLMAEDPNCVFSVDKSPVQYFMEEMSIGNSLRSTTTLGNEKEREIVYDTIFRLPWRCELLIDVGFFVCFDSFLSLLTIMPTRILMTVWRTIHSRQFKRPSAAELSDFGCFTIMACGVTLLQQTDISLIYHMIRGQGTIKLYVVYNVLEIFDKLCQSFNPDVLQTLFNSADGLASCPPENMRFWTWRFICDQALAVAASIIHAFILLAQAITLSTCIVAHNNALLALLVSNNFAEIKSNVFKRFSKDNIHSLVYFDSVERFHISAFLLFVLAQNILEAEGPWFESFLSNALLVYVCEMIIDIIKHSFIAKFNNIKPIAYSEFLEDLCKQTLNIQSEASKKNLTFIPLAPACVVIRVLTPVYAAHLPYSSLPWKQFWILILFAMTYVMLTSLKVLIGMGLQKHASWYVNRCKRRKHHLHYD